MGLFKRMVQREVQIQLEPFKALINGLAAHHSTKLLEVKDQVDKTSSELAARAKIIGQDQINRVIQTRKEQVEWQKSHAIRTDQAHQQAADRSERATQALEAIAKHYAPKEAIKSDHE